MKRILFLVCIFTVFLVGGCSNISQEEAEDLIIEQNSNHLGEATIISSEEQDDHYIIKWENKGNKAWGVSEVSPDGEIKIIDGEIE